MPGLRSGAPSPGAAERQAISRAGLSAAASGAARALVDVAVGDGDVELVVLAIALGEVLGDRDRAVAAAGAADRDHQVRLALGDVLRQQEVEQRVQAP